MSAKVKHSKKKQNKAGKQMDELAEKVMELIYQGHTSLLYHLNITMTKAIEVNKHFMSKLKENPNAKLENYTIFSKIYCYDDSYITKRHTSPKPWLLSSGTVLLKSWSHKLEYGNKILRCMGHKPILITGLIGSGKLTFINALKDLYYANQKIVVVHLDETTDVKNLIGTYYVSETEIEYKKGPLTIAAENGWWILLKNVEKNSDILNGMVVENGYLHVLSGQTIKCKDSFRILATSYDSQSSQNIEILTLEDLTHDDIREICQHKYTNINTSEDLCDKILKSIESLSNSDLNTHLGVKLIYTHDIIRVFNRVNTLLKRMDIEHSTHLSGAVTTCILKEIYDVFISYIYTRDLREACLKMIIDEHWPGIDSYSVVLEIVNLSPKYSFNPDDKSFFFGRSEHIPLINSFHNDFVIESFVGLIEQITIGVTNNETILLVGETGTGKTTIVQNIANVMGKKLNVFNMSQNTDSADLMGGFKPIDTKLMLKPLYISFLELFWGLLDEAQNKDFLKVILDSYNKHKSIEFFKCIDHGINSIDSKIQKLSKKNKKKVNLDDIMTKFSDLKVQLNDTKQKIKKADRSFIFKFIEGKLVQSIKNGDWILLDEINLAPEDVLNKVVSIIDKTVLLTEKADVDNIPIHPDFRMFCCMNPHHSSAGKKALNKVLRSKMTEIFVDELYKPQDIIPIVKTNLCQSYNYDYVVKITQFYIDVKEKIKSLEIHYGTKRPAIGLRNLVRALKYIDWCVNNSNVTFHQMRALYEGIVLCFTTQVDNESKDIMMKMIVNTIFDGTLPNKDILSSLRFSTSISNKDEFVVFEDYALKKGKFDPVSKLGFDANWEDKFIMTDTFKNLVKIFSSIMFCSNFDNTKASPLNAILIEGPTSAGKTSTIEYLAKKTHNKCIRINNHEHTDIQEYVGSYVPDAKGKLVFQEGLLVEAVRNGYWVILDELNLAPSEVLEALNRLLDDNSELFIVETQEVVKAHPKFRLFATQNPTEGYGGRKELSEAFKNRFVILHSQEIPYDELCTIVHKRCEIAPAHAKKLINVMKDLQYYRQESSVFSGHDNVITVRDMLKWAHRDKDTIEVIGHEGYILLAERMRHNSDREFVKQIIEKHLKVKIDIDAYYEQYFNTHLKGIFDVDEETLIQNIGMKSIVITKTLKKLAVVVHKCIVTKEPVLLVGETGWGKTTICQLLALFMNQMLFSINVHQNTETSDFIGCMRTKRDKLANIEALNSIILSMFSLFGELPELLEYKTQLSDNNLWTRISIKQYSKILKLTKALSKSDEIEENEELTTLLNKSHQILVELKGIFEWQDGVLINAMKQGGLLLIDEISLANDSVLERLNSVFETERTLILAEKANKSVIKIVGHPNFSIVSTMNPSGDFGKKELSPALRNRMTEIWVDTYFDQKELQQYTGYLKIQSISDLKADLIMKESDLYVIINEKLKNESLSNILFKIVVYYNFILSVDYNLTRKKLSIRDVLNFIEFYHKLSSTTMMSDYELTDMHIFKEAIKLVIIDGFGIDLTADKDKILGQLEHFINKVSEVDENDNQQELKVVHTGEIFGIEPYLLQNSGHGQPLDHFSFEATKHNVVKILRGLKLGKPILLEGPPGVGKTSTVESIAKAIGKKIIRINLSEHTDMMDLLGSEYPVPVSGGSGDNHDDITFQWCDGALLTAIKQGYWFLLDEMNLAHQSVLEGLNAILDHRKMVYIPELDQEFKCHPDFCIFACQNPIEHGIGRKNLPKSFLNRFTKIYLEDLSDENYFNILKCKYGEYCSDEEIKTLISMTHELEDLLREDKLKNSNEINFDGTEKFNLRDLSRLFKIYTSPMHSSLTKSDRLRLAFQLNSAKLISNVSQSLANLTFSKFTELSWSPPSNYVINSDVDWVEFITPNLLNSQKMLALPKVLSGSGVIPSCFHLSHSVYSHYLYMLSLCIMHNYPVLLISKKHAGKTSLIQTLAYLCDAKLTHIVLSESTDTTDILGSYQQVNVNNKTNFVWTDSVLIQAIQRGNWVIIENFNHQGGSTAVVLDRLNALLEEGNDEIVINEAGLIDGELRVVKAHKNFRVFFLLNEETMMYSNISKPLRNRCWEIYIRQLEEYQIESTVLQVWNKMGISGTKIPLKLFEIHKKNLKDKADETINSYNLPLFFKWMQNIVNSYY